MIQDMNGLKQMTKNALCKSAIIVHSPYIRIVLLDIKGGHTKRLTFYIYAVSRRHLSSRQIHRRRVSDLNVRMNKTLQGVVRSSGLLIFLM